MTETPKSPQAGIAEALGDLSEQTRILVRREIDAAQREMWEKAKESAPALALLGAAGTLGLLAAASAYRLTLRLLERRLSPASAVLPRPSFMVRARLAPPSPVAAGSANCRRRSGGDRAAGRKNPDRSRSRGWPMTVSQ